MPDDTGVMLVGVMADLVPAVVVLLTEERQAECEPGQCDLCE